MHSTSDLILLRFLSTVHRPLSTRLVRAGPSRVACYQKDRAEMPSSLTLDSGVWCVYISLLAQVGFASFGFLFYCCVTGRLIPVFWRVCRILAFLYISEFFILKLLSQMHFVSVCALLHPFPCYCIILLGISSLTLPDHRKVALHQKHCIGCW